MQRDLLLVGEMVEAAEQIQQLVDGVTLDELLVDRQRRDALLWNFTVLGEAAVQVSAGVRERFSAVSWQQPQRLRNRIVHGYWSVDLALLQTTVRRDLPALVERLRTVEADLRR